MENDPRKAISKKDHRIPLGIFPRRAGILREREGRLRIEKGG